jgi:hypothetical protein
MRLSGHIHPANDATGGKQKISVSIYILNHTSLMFQKFLPSAYTVERKI